jgi:hypothetical protein
VLSGPTAFATIGNLLVDAVTARLRSEGLWTSGMTGGLVPAPIVWDDCRCGQLAVAFSRLAPSIDGRNEAFGGDPGTGVPATPTVAMPTPPFLLGELQVAVLRCADASGTPSPDTLTAEATLGLADAHWTLVAVACELKRLLDANEIIDYTLRDTPFLPSAGACQGAQINATVTVPLQCPCD